MAKCLHILYGSETGTAEDVAFKVRRSLAPLLCRRHVGPAPPPPPHPEALVEAPEPTSQPPTPSSSNGDLIDDIMVCELDDLVRESAISDGSQLFSDIRRAVFVVSTTGDGDAPSNMKRFWRCLLQKRLRAGALHHLEFSIFGLGDSSYEKYNAAARRLRQRLLQLGATEAAPIGLGDDQARYGYLQAFDKWMSSLILAFGARGESASAGLAVQAPPEPPVYAVHVDRRRLQGDEVTGDPHLSAIDCLRFDRPLNSYGACDNSEPFEMRVVGNTRLTAESWGQVVCHISLELTKCDSTDFSYVPGDIAVVHPENSEDTVQRALSILQLGPYDVVTIAALPSRTPRKSRIHSTMRCTADDLCRCFLDWNGRPQRSFFECLWMYASEQIDAGSSEELEKLLELASPQGTDLYFDYCIRSKRGYLDVMSDFISVIRRIPLSRLLELVPALKPRSYSIASSPLECPRGIQLCVAKVVDLAAHGRTRTGTASAFLCDLSVTRSRPIFVWIQPGSFRDIPVPNPGATFNAENLPPLMLVGPGTGVAAMRSIIRNRLVVENKKGSRIKVGQTFLFFGCRRRDSDWLYFDEWRTKLDESSGILRRDDESGVSFAIGSITINNSFSRDALMFKYVTDGICFSSKSLWEQILSKEDCRIFISGSAKRMPADVRAAIRNVIAENLCANENNGKESSSATDRASLLHIADARIQMMEREGRYIVEAWS